MKRTNACTKVRKFFIELCTSCLKLHNVWFVACGIHGCGRIYKIFSYRLKHWNLIALKFGIVIIVNLYRGWRYRTCMHVSSLVIGFKNSISLCKHAKISCTLFSQHTIAMGTNSLFILIICLSCFINVIAILLGRLFQNHMPQCIQLASNFL